MPVTRDKKMASKHRVLVWIMVHHSSLLLESYSTGSVMLKGAAFN